MINIQEINPGDQVTLQDKSRNLALGEVKGTSEFLWIEAFGLKVQFARLTRNGTWKPETQTRIVGHVPSLV